MEESQAVRRLWVKVEAMAHYKGPSAPMGRVGLQTVWWGGQCRLDREEDKDEEQKKGRLVEEPGLS